MNLSFPSREFDQAVAAVCRGDALEEEMRALNELLRTNAAARDEYILRVEVHSRLASEREIYVSDAPDEAHNFTCISCGAPPKTVIPFPSTQRPRNRKLAWAVALAACLAFIATAIWGLQSRPPANSKMAADGRAVAILGRTVDAQWNQDWMNPKAGALLQPGRLELKAGLAQFVFFSGARVMIEGPAQIELTSPNEISCRSGLLMAEVPAPARGFRLRTPHVEATGLATIGLNVRGSSTELQVFKGNADVSPTSHGASQNVPEGTGALAERSNPLKTIPGNSAEFAALLNLQNKSLAAETQRFAQWRTARKHLNHDPSLLVHLDFEGSADYPQVLSHDSMSPSASVSETIVGCQMVSGRWADKQGLEFQSVSDRVRLSVPGDFNALTLTAWVRVQGLDRQFSSLFMCDGFDPGEIHWMIVNNGDLAITVKGYNRGHFQASESPPMVSPDRFGTWMQVAVVIDGVTRRITHYFNGRAVGEQPLVASLPLHIGTAELGNWNADGFPIDDHEMWIRNFNGAMDEFCLFSRALSDAEIQELYLAGKPEAGN